jgi:polysaccharide deacetylase 2 family uncharacterized protein YibQ
MTSLKGMNLQMDLMKPGSRAGLFLWLFLICGVGTAIFPVKMRAAALTQSPEVRGKVAIIIDDIGLSSENMDEVIGLPTTMTWAILPETAYGRQYAAEARKLGVEILLHQPLEPLDSNQDPGPGLIKREDTATQVSQQLALNLESVPGAVGINNHMGSAGTADEPLMNVLMWAVKRSNLFFIDSETGPHSVAWQYARLYQVPFGRRDVFIDNDQAFQTKRDALEKLLELAVRHGSAIGIGHARKGTGAAIQAMLPRFAGAGVELVHVSELTK